MYFALFKVLVVSYAARYPYLNVINHLLDFVIRRLMKDTIPDGVDLADYLEANNRRIFDGNQRLIRDLHDTAAVGLAWICYGENCCKRGHIEHFDVKFWQAALLGLLIRQLRTQIVYLNGDSSLNKPKLQKQLIESLAILMRHQESLGARDDLYYKVVNDDIAVTIIGTIIRHEARLFGAIQLPDYDAFRLHYTKRAGYLAASWEMLPSDEIPKQVGALTKELNDRTLQILLNQRQGDLLASSISNALFWGLEARGSVDEEAKAFLATENGKLLADSVLHVPTKTA